MKQAQDKAATSDRPWVIVGSRPTWLTLRGTSNLLLSKERIDQLIGDLKKAREKLK